MKEYSEVILRRQGETGATILKHLKPGRRFGGMEVERLLVNSKGELIVWLKTDRRRFNWLANVPAMTRRSSDTHLQGLLEDFTHVWQIELPAAA